MGAPRALYDKPRTPFVRDFLGKVAVLEGVVAAAPGPLEVAVRLNETARSLVSRALPDGPAPGVGEAAEPRHLPGARPVEPGDREPRAAELATGGSGSALVHGPGHGGPGHAGRRPKRPGAPVAPAELREGEQVRVEFPPEHVKLWGQ